MTVAPDPNRAISARINAITARLDAARPVPAAAELVMPDLDTPWEFYRELHDD